MKANRNFRILFLLDRIYNSKILVNYELSIKILKFQIPFNKTSKQKILGLEILNPLKNYFSYFKYSLQTNSKSNLI